MKGHCYHRAATFTHRSAKSNSVCPVTSRLIARKLFSARHLKGTAADDVIARMARFGLLLLQGNDPLDVQVGD